MPVIKFTNYATEVISNHPFQTSFFGEILPKSRKITDAEIVGIESIEFLNNFETLVESTSNRFVLKSDLFQILIYFLVV